MPVSAALVEDYHTITQNLRTNVRKREWVQDNSTCLACEVTQCARAVLLGCFQWDGSPQANDHGDAA